MPSKCVRGYHSTEWVNRNEYIACQAKDRRDGQIVDETRVCADTKDCVNVYRYVFSPNNNILLISNCTDVVCTLLFPTIYSRFRAIKCYSRNIQNTKPKKK